MKISHNREGNERSFNNPTPGRIDNPFSIAHGIFCFYRRTQQNAVMYETNRG